VGSGSRRISGLPLDLRGSTRDFYARADLSIARRLGGLLWIAGTAIAVVLMPIAPPDASALGEWGWAVVAGAVLLSLLVGARLLRKPREVSPNELMLMSYGALAVITLFVWLGGESSPYRELFLLAILYTAAVHPPRRVLVYLAAVFLALAAPLLYDGWSASLAADVVGRLIIWYGLALVAMAYTERVRRQRVGLVRERREASALARVDALTGLGNRRAFDEALHGAIERAQRTGGPVSVIVADLDGFKEINDRWGHIVGDECLRSVAEVVRSEVRTPDTCFRWGGDEFAILADADETGADVLRMRVADAVGQRCSTPDGRSLSVRLGAAQLREEITGEELVARADLDLIAAKAEA
jgi:diguanylate cyclase (GGDEF)-like protein